MNLSKHNNKYRSAHHAIDQPTHNDQSGIYCGNLHLETATSRLYKHPRFKQKIRKHHYIILKNSGLKEGLQSF